MSNLQCSSVLLGLVLVVLCLGVASAQDVVLDWPGVPADGHVGTIINYTGKGMEIQAGGLNVYLALPSKGRDGRDGGHSHHDYSDDERRHSKLPAVLIFSDIYGWKLNNTRKWADDLANNGFRVFMPDFFKNGPIAPKPTPFSEIFTWLQDNQGQPIMDAYTRVVQDLRARYGVRKIGVQGFCWGGRYAMQSAILNITATPAAATVIYHGSFIFPEEVQLVQRPILFVQSDPDVDAILPRTTYDQVKAVIDAKRANGLDARIFYYPGENHGFALRGNFDANPQIAADARDAFRKGVQFLQQYLGRD
eukprot:jgi/Chrzof1/8117/UNPLg00162.t1